MTLSILLLAAVASLLLVLLAPRVSAVNFWANNAILKIANQSLDLVTDTIKVLLVDATNDADDEDDNVGDITTLGEISVTGYTGGHGGAGRKSLTTKSFAVEDVSDRAVFACDSVTWTALGSGATIRGIIMHKEGAADDTTAVIVGFFAANQATNGGDITLSWTDGKPCLFTRASGS